MVFRHCRLLLLFLLTAAAMRSAFASKDSVPDWVRSAAQQTIPSYPSDTNAVNLLDETTCTVGPDGHAVEHHRHVIKILRPAGREDATVYVRYDKDSKLLNLHVWSIAPDGHEYAVKDNEILDLGYGGSGNFYEDDRYKVAKAPGRDPGGVIAYEYAQNIHPYLTEIDWDFQRDIPSLSSNFTLELPQNFTYTAAWAHTKPVEPIDLEHQRYRWETKNVPAVDLDRVPMHPSEWSLAGKMVVHYSSPGLAIKTGDTWQSIGEWYQQLAKDRILASPEITAKATALTAGKTDFYDRSEVVAEFVQQKVRYFVVEMGIGGWQPHPAADIFRNGYGDCKDKATLLAAMLSAVGIHATQVLVDTHRNVIDPDAPSMFGNHMIAAIEIPKGYDSPKLKSVITAKTGRRYLIFDPTWEKTALASLNTIFKAGTAFLSKGAIANLYSFQC